MRFQVQIWVVGALLAVPLAIGCGSSDGSDSSAAVTKQGFLKEADAVCAEQKRKIQPVLQSSNIEKASKVSIAALRVEAREIEAIGTPSDDETQLKSMMGNVNKALGHAESKSPDLFAANRALLRAEKQADSYGLKVCFLG